MNSPTFIRLRFAFKLSFAIVFALFVGFHLSTETPLVGDDRRHRRRRPGLCRRR